jgi:hypothetical protein
MPARPKTIHLLLGCVLAVLSLCALPGCSMPSALSKAELDAAELPEKHPPVSAAKEKAGCRSCHREREEVKAAE